MKKLHIYILFQMLCSCNKTQQISHRYSTKGETAEVLKEQYNDPSPHYELLGTPIAGSSKKLIKVFICKAKSAWTSDTMFNDEYMKQLNVFKNWVLGNEGYHGFLKGAEFKDESTIGKTGNDEKFKWTFKRLNGPEIGGNKIANDWLIEINDECQNIDDDFQVLIFNGSAYAVHSGLPFKDKTNIPYTVTLLNECGSENHYETRISNIAMESKFKFGIVSSRNMIYLVNFANSNASFLTGLSRGQKWSDILLKMNSGDKTASKDYANPNYVVRTDEVHVGFMEGTKSECAKLSGYLNLDKTTCEIDPNVLNELQCIKKHGIKRYKSDKSNEQFETSGNDMSEENRKRYPIYTKCSIRLNMLWSR